MAGRTGSRGSALAERPLGALLDRLAGAGAEGEVSVDDLLDRLGRTSFTTLLLTVSLLVVTPLSTIPGFSSFCGILIVWIAGQKLLGRPHVYLPAWLRRRSVSAEALVGAIDRIRPPAGWLDRFTRPRLGLLVRAPLRPIVVAFTGLCGAVMPFLEIIPLTSSILGAAVLLVALGLLTRDGLLILAALVPVAVLVGVATTAVSLVT